MGEQGMCPHNFQPADESAVNVRGYPSDRRSLLRRIHCLLPPRYSDDFTIKFLACFGCTCRISPSSPRPGTRTCGHTDLWSEEGYRSATSCAQVSLFMELWGRMRLPKCRSLSRLA